MQSVAYLGHIISSKGVLPDPEKIQAIVAWPLPRSLTALRGFNEVYCKFVHNYVSITTPLTDLLRSTTFQWCVQAQQAFTDLKNKITSVPVLALSDINSPFVIETDVSNNRVHFIPTWSSDSLFQQRSLSKATGCVRLCARNAC
uniref:Reverse transcriptase/retrotransposon-derived protein RNase H-like domain-containing protein n=1 Tax=Cajanus cajan TaxID=3821 RepID=A0A151R5C0_CAJCA|nr:hypothetical protein KK1_041008 [Cajanus cajan]